MVLGKFVTALASFVNQLLSVAAVPEQLCRRKSDVMKCPYNFEEEL